MRFARSTSTAGSAVPAMPHMGARGGPAMKRSADVYVATVKYIAVAGVIVRTHAGGSADVARNIVNAINGAAAAIASVRTGRTP